MAEVEYTKHLPIAFAKTIESLEPVATALLQVLSFLYGGSVPEEILTLGAKKVDLEHYPSTKATYLEAHKYLIRSSLITKNLQVGILRIYRLVQDVVRQRLDKTEFKTSFDASTVLLSEVWPFVDNSNLNEVDRLRKVQKYQPQVSKLRDILVAKGVDTVKASLLIAALLNESAW